VATFNQQDYIAEAVESLASQTDEIVVVDDASTDETLAVLHSLRLDNLRVLSNDRQLGVSWSFNRAVAEVTADVLLIQGGDDRSMPGRAQLQSAALEDPRVTLVHSVPRVIDRAGLVLPDELAAEFQAKPGDADALGFLFFSANYICAPAAALRRKDYEAAGGFRVGLDLLQDYALWLDLSALGSILDLEQPVVEYRKHGTNLSREYTGLDSPKRRRLATEMDFIRNRFLVRASEETLARLAALCGLDGAWFATLPADDKVLMIQLSHQDKLVNRRGVATLFELAGTEDADARFASLGLEPSDLARFAITADHENLEDVGRALAVVRSLSPVPTAHD
jgi:glycosyltransferase involved in cell wall biosynthesis